MELTLTPKQILEIYEAGIQRGCDVYSAYECGCRTPAGSELDELENALVWNGLSYCNIRNIEDYDAKQIWWEQFKTELF